MQSLWSQGLTDLTVIVVKSQADEDMVTYQRIKLVERGKEAKGEGSGMITKCNQMY